MRYEVRSFSNPTTCSADQFQTTDTTGATFDGSCTNDAGLTTNAAPLTIKRDVTPPVVSVTGVSDGSTYTLGSVPAAGCTTSDATSGVAVDASLSVSGGVPPGVGAFTASCSGAKDNAGNAAATKSASYTVQFAQGGLCLGSPGHAILQPINADGSSVFKQKSTVPAKFRVCDANGNSIGSVAVVSAFGLSMAAPGVSGSLDDPMTVASTTPDTMFRWDPTDQQWIFNINTKGLSANSTYYFQIKLIDGSVINFRFGLK